MKTIDNLWGEEFVLPTSDTEKLLEKIKSPKKVKTSNKVSKKLSIEDKMAVIASNVKRILGKHESDTVVIRDVESLHEYISKAIENGIIAYDTETNNSLDTTTCLIMGACLYTPGQKQAYVPVNHVDYKTEERLADQVNEEELGRELSRLCDGVKIIYHNASFDIRVTKNTCGVELPYYWDTMIASQILDENERASLKEQYMLHVDKGHGKYDIEGLFEKERYAIFDPSLFALYAATDAMMTYRLYEYQLAEFTKSGNEGIFGLYTEVELPVLKSFMLMEERGIEIDLEYDKRLSEKYHRLLDEFDLPINEELDRIKPAIDEWRKSEDANVMVGNKTKSEQLTEPINLTSNTQLAILVYDVLKIPPVNKKKPRSMDKETIPMILEKHDVPLLRLLLERKTFATLVNNFIDKIPEFVSPRDGRVHCSFNQVGTATGRVACSNPNLQQIPSKNHEIRLMFQAKEGYVLCGADFSQQEPRLLANYCKDESLIYAYANNRDLYATIASKVYGNEYEDNLEFDPRTGKRNDDGANRRSSCKSLLLGINYGMSVAGIADKIKCSKEEAQKFLNDFYKQFPKVKSWSDETIETAKKTGYVEDWHGRRRRLPDLTLPRYTIKYVGDSNALFNPFIGCEDRDVDPADEARILGLLSKARGIKEVNGIIASERDKGIQVIDNEGFIARASRQCVNARIQGGAATMTKVAMINIDADRELNELGFKMLIGVHDELIGECPEENAEKVADRLSYIMRTCMGSKSVVPFKCDADVSKKWYYNVYCSELQKNMKNLQSKGMSYEEALAEIEAKHTESTHDFIVGCLKQG